MRVEGAEDTETGEEKVGRRQAQHLVGGKEVVCQPACGGGWGVAVAAGSVSKYLGSSKLQVHLSW